ncbi:hypothetical protein RvY_12805 [Ramazzottius varieornatus]|uniref:Nuclear receptor domain-containing protein n=1 Tax=Ramazzottius varieornatus TaxID=947166 RepID=A0A1D1VMS0_RAMVA|nr:hypothetical protein RvY_12805 [Ramazzottius varieornatus]
MLVQQVASELQQIFPDGGSKVSLDHEYTSFKMNQLCKVCGEPAAGFHFGAFTCEGCKSFFGRTYSNTSQMGECKNGGSCKINRKNRTSCKACRLRKCLMVGMSKSGSRYGRRSNWFKIHCLLQNQKDGSSEGHDGDEEEGMSDRTLSTPNSLKSATDHSPTIWNPSLSPATSPNLKSDRDDVRSDASSLHMPYISPFFQANPFFVRPHATMPVSPQTGFDFEQLQMRPEMWRWYMPQIANMIQSQQNNLTKMTFDMPVEKVQLPSPSVSSKTNFSSPSPRVEDFEFDEDQPLDLSAKRGRNYSGESHNHSSDSHGTSHTTPDTSDNEMEDSDDYRMTDNRRPMQVLDLSIK